MRYLSCGLALGWVVLTLLTSPSTVAADEPGQPTVGARARPILDLGETTRGEAAIRALGGRLEEVARAYGKDAATLREELRSDASLAVDSRGHLHFTDDPLPAGGLVANAEPVLAAASIPLADTFKLHSRSGSKRIIYLDFNGQVLSGTVWNNSYASGGNINAPPYDIDGNPGAFNDTELTRIQQVWRRVSEDFAPFDVDVTTELSSEALITRTSASDEYYGMRVLISPISSLVGNYGGIAYVGVFDDVGDFYKPALVFPEKLGQSSKNIAEAVSHEAGHTLGLSHDGTTTGTAYYTGHGSGQTGWAPIMGVGYYQNLSQWSKGEYTNANNKQDDLSIIQSYGLLKASDDFGNTDANAAYLPAGTTLYANGLIGLGGDVDVFAFATGSGTASLLIVPSDLGPNLDISAELFDSNGLRLATNNPATSLDASFNVSLAAGTYFLRVRGTGWGDPLTTGYTSYGSLGSYTLTGTIPDPTGSVPPIAVASASPTSGTAPLAVNFDAAGSFDQDGSVTSYLWDFGDGTSASGATAAHTYLNLGTYTAILTVTDDDGLVGQDSVAISVLAPNLLPTANLVATPTTGTAPLIVNFNGSTSWDSDGSIVGYVWSFGDGTPNGSGASLQHTYQNTGNYAARLTVTDDRGGTSSQTVNIQVAAASLVTIRVESIALTSQRNSAGTSVTSRVRVTNLDGLPVAGVSVTGQWSGVLAGASTATTDANGYASMTSKRNKKTGSLSFAVTGLAKSGCSYDPTRNLVSTASIQLATLP
ncbi:MAG: PKD domain-containing protein [Verrucomicrobiales bacterium]|nr:PKD domain-containing protein [Verrucomicrobiales bacterium]